MSSSLLRAEAPIEEKPKHVKRRVGLARKLDKRVVVKADRRYLIYYTPV